MADLPDTLKTLARTIVNRVRSAPPDTPDSKLYALTGRLIAAHLQRVPPASEGQFLRGYMGEVLSVLYDAPAPISAEELQRRVAELTGQSPTYTSINHCLRKGEARLMVNRARVKGQARSLVCSLTQTGRQYVEEQLRTQAGVA